MYNVTVSSQFIASSRFVKYFCTLFKGGTFTTTIGTGKKKNKEESRICEFIPTSKDGQFAKAFVTSECSHQVLFKLCTYSEQYGKYLLSACNSKTRIKKCRKIDFCLLLRQVYYCPKFTTWYHSTGPTQCFNFPREEFISGQIYAFDGLPSNVEKRWRMGEQMSMKRLAHLILNLDLII
uniref:Uncharacterized protein n=1 Tax=Glossina pallidipes TaxID=7398 RepID=A0A1B0A675_GLOPL